MVEYYSAVKSKEPPWFMASPQGEEPWVTRPEECTPTPTIL